MARKTSRSVEPSPWGGGPSKGWKNPPKGQSWQVRDPKGQTFHVSLGDESKSKPDLKFNAKGYKVPKKKKSGQAKFRRFTFAQRQAFRARRKKQYQASADKWGKGSSPTGGRPNVKWPPPTR